MDGWYKFFTWVVTIAVLLLFAAGIVYRVEIGTQVSMNIAAYGLIGLFALVFLFDFLPQYMSTYIPIASALLFGMNLFAVCVVSIAASTIGSILAFEIGRKASKHFINHVIDEKAHKKVEHATNAWGKWVVLIGALTPVPYIPMLYGALKLTRKNFYIYGIIPNVVNLLAATLLLALIF
jgi:membrane protein DedA with SNARE-associated domain